MHETDDRDDLKIILMFQAYMTGNRSIINRMRKAKRQYWLVKKKQLDVVPAVYKGLMRREG